MSKARNKAPRKKPTASDAPALDLRSVRFSASGQSNPGKIMLLHRLNDHVVGLKRRMSEHVHQHRSLLLSEPKTLQGQYKAFESDWLNAWERQALLHDVLGTYMRRASQLLDANRFSIQTGWSVQRYQRNVTRHGRQIANAGWVKSGTFELKTTGTPLSRAANVLLQLDPGRLDLGQCSDRTRELLEPLQSRPAIWERLLRLVSQRQQRLLGKIKVHQFTTGTHKRDVTQSRCRIVRDDGNRKFQWWYELRVGTGKAASLVRLPLAFDKDYFDPSQARLDQGHMLKVSRGKMHVVCTREAPVPVFKEPGRLVGLDANTKHNLLASSDHRAYDYDRLWLDTLITQLERLDAKGTANLGYRDKARLAKLVRANEAALKRRIHEILAELHADGVTDIVMEDLTGFRGTMLSRHPQFEQKYTRLLRLLRLSSLKDWVASQAEKFGMRVHLAHAAYSSQRCPHCGHISPGNRPSQEQFRCEACGHAAPADFVSATNLAHRLSSDVPRRELHAFDKFGRASPVAMKRARLKGILLAAGAGGVIDLPTPASTTKAPPLAGRGL